MPRPRCGCYRSLTRRAPSHGSASRTTIVACRSAVSRNRQVAHGAPASPAELTQPSAANRVQRQSHEVPPSPRGPSPGGTTPPDSSMRAGRRSEAFVLRPLVDNLSLRAFHRSSGEHDTAEQFTSEAPGHLMRPRNGTATLQSAACGPPVVYGATGGDPD